MNAPINFPLVVDLDGTLTTVDTLAEAVVRLIKKSQINLLRMCLWLLRGRAIFKARISEHCGEISDNLPFREPFIEYLRNQKSNGRRLILATAAHKLIADAVSMRLGLFDDVLATESGKNLKGATKLVAIQALISGPFSYAGDSKFDIPIWKKSQGAVLVGVSDKTRRVVRQYTPIECEFYNESIGLLEWMRALRVHQWLKNLLLFVPLLTAFSVPDGRKVITIVVSFLAFSLVASATYIVNDLWDLDSDRAHIRKRNRPFASGAIAIGDGLVVASLLIILGFGLAMLVSKGFFFILMLYLLLTSVYSWMLKEYVLLDVLMLSMLYTLRILAGSVAIGVTTSSWLLAFSVFLFISLALVKRCAELVSLSQRGVSESRGRDYRVSDLSVLWPLGSAAALSAVVIFGLFIDAPDTRVRYTTPNILWLVAWGLIYWLARLWIKTSRGEMHDDPIIYALKDRGSRFTIIAMISLVVVARFINFDSIL